MRLILPAKLRSRDHYVFTPASLDFTAIDQVVQVGLTKNGAPAVITAVASLDPRLAVAQIATDQIAVRALDLPLQPSPDAVLASAVQVDAN